MATGILGNRKNRQRKIRGYGEKGNTKLMCEITATEKTATGKLGNGKIRHRKMTG